MDNTQYQIQVKLPNRTGWETREQLTTRQRAEDIAYLSYVQPGVYRAVRIVEVKEVTRWGD